MLCRAQGVCTQAPNWESQLSHLPPASGSLSGTVTFPAHLDPRRSGGGGFGSLPLGSSIVHPISSSMPSPGCQHPHLDGCHPSLGHCHCQALAPGLLWLCSHTCSVTAQGPPQAGPYTPGVPTWGSLSAPSPERFPCSLCPISKAFQNILPPLTSLSPALCGDCSTPCQGACNSAMTVRSPLCLSGAQGGTGRCLLA